MATVRAVGGQDSSSLCSVVVLRLLLLLRLGLNEGVHVSSFVRASAKLLFIPLKGLLEDDSRAC